MSLSPDSNECTSALPMSDLCTNLDNQFLAMQDLSKAEGMHVYARIRPMLNSEIDGGYKECVAAIDEQTVRALVPSSSAKYKSNREGTQDIIEDFTFTAAYGPETGQFVFFQECMMDTMQNFIEGQNSLVFSYGITGSGKTFTLQGDIENPGIIPLSLHLFFASVENQLLNTVIVKPDKFSDVTFLNENERKKEIQIKEQLLSASDQEDWNIGNDSRKSFAVVLCETFSEKNEVEERQTTLCPEEMAQAQAATLMKEVSKKSAEEQEGYCSIWVSFAEIYNESIYDLLQPVTNQRPKLNLGEDKNGDVYIKGLREVCVFNSYEALKLLTLGQKNLRIASTKLNYQSSRSHCIFTVKVIRIPDTQNITYARINRLSFCDLAGSERAAKSQTTGLRLKEAACINTSLLVLGKCLDQLRLNPSLRDKKLVPFRESKLTRLFSGYFIGRGRAVMIANASPSELTFDETLHVLRFSAISKEIIINDSYIATASNTLQTISNMWTNTRSNVSVSSDKSISFEDSVEEVIQEKDELIEKLLDLAESLRNNLEREKKEKTELEIKIRQDVCREYSEYSDQLLKDQKQIFEEESDSIKEAFKKRLTAMETMYEKIIKDYKAQLEESDTSDDEEIGTSKLEVTDIKREDIATVENTPGVSNAQDTDQKCETHTECIFAKEAERLALEVEDLTRGLQIVNEELRKCKDELQKSTEYASNLEDASMEIENKIEISNSNLEKALAENEKLKNEIDSLLSSYHEDMMNLEADKSTEKTDKVIETLEEECKAIKFELQDKTKLNEELQKKFDAVQIDYVFYKTDNDNLNNTLKSLEEKVKSLSEELDNARREKDILQGRLIKSENDHMNCENKIHEFMSKIHALEENHRLSCSKYEEAELKATQLDKKLTAAHQQLEAKKKEIADLEIELSFQTKKVIDLENKDNHKAQFMETLSQDLALIKKEKVDLQEEIEILKARIVDENKLSNDLKEEIEKLNVKSAECEEQHQKVAAELDDKLTVAYQELEEKKKEIADLEKELACERKKVDLETELHHKAEFIESLSRDLSLVKKEKVDLQDEMEILKARIAAENKLNNNFEAELEKLNSKYAKSEEQHAHALKHHQKETEEVREILVAANKALEIATLESENQKVTVESLEKQCDSYKKDIYDLQNIRKDLEEKCASISEELEAQKLEFESKELDLTKTSWELKEKDKELCALQSEYSLYKNKMSELEKTDEILKEKLFISNDPHVSENNELEALQSECKFYENEVSELRKTNSILKEKLSVLDDLQIAEKQKQEVGALHCRCKLECNDNVPEIEKANSLLEEKISLSTKLESMIAEKNVVEEKLQESEKQLDALKEKLCILEDEHIQFCNMKEEKDNLSKELKETETNLANVKKDLESALEDVEGQRKEINSLNDSQLRSVNSIEELQHSKKSLEDQVANLINDIAAEKSSHEDKLNSLNAKLEEALHIIEEQKTELNTLHSEFDSCKNEILQLKDNAEKEYNSDVHIKLDLIEILEKCELKATTKIEKLQLASENYEDAIKALNEQLNSFENANEAREKEYNTLQKDFKSFQVSSKKQLQSEKEKFDSEIKHLKELQNTELKEKESKLKLSLQTAKEKFESEMESLKKLHEAEFKEKESELKLSLQTEKEKFISEMKVLKELYEFTIREKELDMRSTVTDSVNPGYVVGSEAESKKRSRSSSKRNEFSDRADASVVKEEKSCTVVLEKFPDKKITEDMNFQDQKIDDSKFNTTKTSTETKRSSRQKEKEQKKSELCVKSVQNVPKPESKDDNEKEADFDKRKTRTSKTSMIKTVSEVVKIEADVNAKENVEGEKRKRLRATKSLLKNKENESEKTVTVKKIDETESEKTVIEKRNAEKRVLKNISHNSENIQGKKTRSNETQVRTAGQRQLRNMENITVFHSVSDKNSGLVANKQLKRKKQDEVADQNSSATRISKKIKLHGGENVLKPQNLRVQALLGKIGKTDIVPPSPRMTRGRKKLFALKNKNTVGSTASPKTVRW